MSLSPSSDSYQLGDLGKLLTSRFTYLVLEGGLCFPCLVAQYKWGVSCKSSLENAKCYKMLIPFPFGLSAFLLFYPSIPS